MRNFKFYNNFILAILALVILTFSSPVIAGPAIGAMAPDFEHVAVNGDPVRLSEFRGHPVILEWTNHECPFVRKHYDSGNMQKIQQYAANKGFVWISIVSSAPGKQGNVTPEQAMDIEERDHAVITEKILDESGEIGRLYGAMTTPHMFVIDAGGHLVYAGAIDSIASSNPEDISQAENYIIKAIDDISINRALEYSQTKPYGCSVKY